MKTVYPPKFAARLFNWYCGMARVEDLQGDMDELFYMNVKRRGAFVARFIYIKQVFSLIFSYAISKRKNDAAYHPLSFSGGGPMLRNYFKVGIRSLARQKYFTILNAGGLAIGMSICLLFITLFITVTDYDEFHVNKHEIYRIITTDPDHEYASAPAALAERMVREYPGLKSVTRIGRYLSTSEPQPKQEVYVQGYFVDPSFLETFTFPLLKGDKGALDAPNTIIITEAAAKRVFGESDPMGKVISMGSHGDFEIKGVLRNYPANSHMTFDVLASYSTLDGTRSNVPVAKQWSEFDNHYVYIQVAPEGDLDKLQQYLNRVAGEVYAGQDYKATFELQALTDITPGPELDDQIGPQWSYLSFGVAGALGLLILLPACFNYTNISIARAMRRSKEIGLRKTMGGVRSQIFFQFITETVIVTLLALVGGCLIFFVIRGEFQAMLVHASALDLSLTVGRVLWFILFAVITGFVAGVFPAIYFSRLNPIDAIKNAPGLRLLSGERMRKGLTIFQFALSLTFILTLIVFSKQYRYVINYDLGFTKANILDVRLQQMDADVVKNEFSRLPEVRNVSASSGVIGHGLPGVWTRMEGNTDSATMYYMHIDDQFISNVDLELIAGRTFSAGEAAERTIVVNEAFLERFGFKGPSEALGERVEYDSSSAEIIGVIKNFHFWSLYGPIKPFAFRYNKDKLRFANVKIATQDMQQTFIDLERTWNKVANGRVFSAEFLETETDGAFQQYRTVLKIFGFLGLLAISVSCLGLLGMVVYTTETRTKEVGIRKVMGASTWSVTYLLARGFLKLMAIAALFAIPVTLGLDFLLSGMVYYRVEISPGDVVLGLVMMFALGLATMASQTFKTANTNPAETLRSE